jgi:hypothetical protein
VVLRSAPGAPGVAAVSLTTATKAALPFDVDLVALPAGAPLLQLEAEPGAALTCVGAGAAAPLVRARLTSFRALAPGESLRIEFRAPGGAAVAGAAEAVASFLDSTSFTVRLPLALPGGGAVRLRAWAAADAEAARAGEAELLCADVATAELAAVVPDRGPAGAALPLSILVRNSGLAAGDDVLLWRTERPPWSPGASPAQRVRSAALGGDPAEVALAPWASEPGVVAFSAAPAKLCPNPLAAACLAKTVTFSVAFYDPADVPPHLPSY